MWLDDARSFAIRFGLVCAGILLVAIALLVYHSNEVTQPRILVPDRTLDRIWLERFEESVYGSPTIATEAAADCIVFDDSSHTAEFYYDDANDSRFWPVNVVRRLWQLQYEVIFTYAFSNQCEHAVSFKADLHYLDDRDEPISSDHTSIVEIHIAAGASYRHTHRGFVSPRIRNHAHSMHPIIYEAYGSFAGG